MPDPIDTRAFEAMTTAVDKTAVSLFEPEDEKGCVLLSKSVVFKNITFDFLSKTCEFPRKSCALLSKRLI